MTFTMAGSTDACNSMKIRANYKSEFSFKERTKKEMNSNSPASLPWAPAPHPQSSDPDPRGGWSWKPSLGSSPRPGGRCAPWEGDAPDASHWDLLELPLTLIPSWGGIVLSWTFVLFGWGTNLSWTNDINFPCFPNFICFPTWLWKETSLRHWAWTRGRKRYQRQCKTEKTSSSLIVCI